MGPTFSWATTTFRGNHYVIPQWDEVTGSNVAEYYFAGTTRIAMRKYVIPQSMTVEYFLDNPVQE